MKNLLLILIVGWFSLTSYPEYTRCFNLEVKFTPAQLKADLALLHQTLEQKHIGLYRYTSPAEIEQLFKTFYAATNQPLTELEFYRLITPLVGKIKCGHTRAQLSEQYQSQAERKARYFPLKVKFFGTKAYADINSLSKNATPFFVKLVSINGTPMDTIVAEMAERFALDGDSQMGKYRFFENFAHYYALFIAQPDTFNLVGQVPRENQSRQWQVKGVSRLQLADRQLQGNLPVALPLRFQISQGTGYLKIQNFNPKRHQQSGKDFKQFIAQSFAQLATNQTTHLVIDIRGNGGGDDSYGPFLFSYLARKPFCYFKSIFGKENGKMIEVAEYPGLGWQPRHQNAFKGRVFLLTDGLTFSTAADFAAIFKYQKRGKIIGEETGGGYYGNNSGDSYLFTLPYTNIIFNIPLWQYTNAVAGCCKRRGVLPDYPIAATLEDYLGNKDVALHLAQNLIRQSKDQKLPE